MSFLSNFDGVTMSDATHMRVQGRSDRGDEVKQLLIAIAALPPDTDEAGLGAPMIPDDSAVLEASLDGPFVFGWTFHLTCEPGAPARHAGAARGVRDPRRGAARCLAQHDEDHRRVSADLPNALHRSTPEELRERLAAERSTRAFLLYRDGEGAQRILELDGAPDRLTVGRNATNWLALPWDSEASRVHATFERLGDEWTLVDDGRARNGTFVDGERVSGRRRLRDGETLQMGRTVMLFRSPEDESAATELSAHAVAPTVSAAQLRVLQALCRPYAQGRFAAPASNAEIAAELVLGVETVKTHMKALYEAFELEGTGEPRRAGAARARVGPSLSRSRSGRAGPTSLSSS